MTFHVEHRHLSGGVLDSEVAEMLKAAEEENAPAIETLTPKQARDSVGQRVAETSGEKISSVKTKDQTIPGPHGEIPIRIFSPPGEGPFPVIVYFHGGGWVICNVESHDPPCRQLCKYSDCIVISVDYRLAPENKFPVAIDEAYETVQWVFQNASSINAIADKIAIGGDSAGGNIATVTALRIKEEGGLKLAYQLLIYPVTDLSNFDRQSYQDYSDGFFLSRNMMEWFRNHYLNSIDEAKLAYTSPLLAEDLSGLPPAFVLTAEYDPLRDEGELYARKLYDAGVPVKCVRYNGMIHPFWSLGGVISAAHQAYQEAGEHLKQCLY